MMDEEEQHYSVKNLANNLLFAFTEKYQLCYYFDVISYDFWFQCIPMAHADPEQDASKLIKDLQKMELENCLILFKVCQKKFYSHVSFIQMDRKNLYSTTRLHIQSTNIWRSLFCN